MQSVFFLLRSVGRRDLSAGPEQKKKNTTQGVFFCSGPGERQGKEKPRAGAQRGFSFPCLSPNGASPSPACPHGRSKKKTPWVVFFFAAAPRGRSLTHCGPGWRCLPLAGVVFVFLLRGGADRGGVFFLLWPRPDAHSLTVGWGDFGKARVVFFFLLRPRRVFLDNNKKCLGYYIGSKKTRRGHSKKKNTTSKVFFFCSGPVPAPNGASPSPAVPGAGATKKTPWVVFLFLLWPRAGAQRGFSFPCLSPGPQQKKKTPWVVFFFLLWPRAGAQRGFSFPCLSPGPEQKKKNTLGGVFFCCGPARTLTHSLRAWVAMPPPRRGGDFFLLRPRPDRGGVFFFCCGPARTLTHSRWAGAISARPGWCFFFAAAPPGLLDNNKKCLGYYIGSKKTRRGHSKKKNTTSAELHILPYPREDLESRSPNLGPKNY